MKSWEPVRKGAIYCAPACGHGCTWAEYQDALARAKKVCEELGEGWEPDLSENMGWFASVRRGSVRISLPMPWFGAGYFCHVDGCGSLGRAVDARGALLDALGRMEDRVEAEKATLRKLREAL